MPRPFNRRQALENQAFLKALRRTGNTHLAARELGMHRTTLFRRRARHPAFAAEWDAALALAHANLQASLKDPSRIAPHREDEPLITRLGNGRLQLRHATPRRLTRAGEQAFLAALSATANIRLSAAAAGFSHSVFYQRREASPAFAREMRLALQMGYERLEMALLESFAPDSHRDDAWRHNDPPPIPAMSPAQALQLLYLHQKEAVLWGERPDRRKKRGESSDAWSARAARKWKAEKAWDREGYEVRRAALREGPRRSPHEPPAPELPALDQVTGWSDAEAGKAPLGDGRALFGGWRLKDWEG
ncbi:hypothetical protein IAG41_08480 [Sphingomonas sp. JC676]|uniref:helix-turn-helix domain-containing protein n=1 Tax=Sphingomonas sp. JC676 TaxID=2768065 RepID=UPI0016577D0C|nr:helix-turn-helix domain-containing protein [Sphingomonas sp. JC676]MBC9032424.1 hypothetical protein [Sphingomonas sp. JC676]